MKMRCPGAAPRARMLALAPILLLLAAMPPARAAAWRAELGATGAGAVIAADAAPALPGIEVIAAAADGSVACFDAAGTLLWRAPAAAAPLAGGPVLAAAHPQGPTLLAATATGALIALDAASGAERWRAAVPAAPQIAVLWADLDGDGAPEAAAAGKGLAVFDASGRPAWSRESDAPCAALAAADTDGDGAATLYWGQGPAAFDAAGSPLWTAEPAALREALAVADTDGDALFELIAAGGSPAALTAYDADTGDERWSTPIEGADAAPLALAAADLERDGKAETLLGAGAHAAVFDGSGTLLWRADAGAAVGALLAVDYDADSEVDVAAATPGGVVLFGAGGAPMGRIAAAALAGTPAFADLDNDRRAECLLAEGSGLRAESTGVYPVALLMPWPMAAQGPAGAAALPQTDSVESPDLPIGQQTALANGGFEEHAADAAAPAGWASEADPAAWGSDPAAMNGQAALRVGPAPGAVRVSSAPHPVSGGVRSVTAGAFGKGEGARAALVQWLDRGGAVLREDRLRGVAPNPQGWRRFTAGELRRPAGARSVRMVLESAPAAAPVYWDDAALTLSVEYIPRIQLAWSRPGYDSGGPKNFTAWASASVAAAQFELIGSDNTVAFSGAMARPEPIADAFGNDWGGFYSRGDFTEFRGTGEFRLRVRMGELSAESAPFRVAPDLMWDGVFAPVAAYVAGQARPEGGWREDAAGAIAPTAQYTQALAELYDMLLWRYRDPIDGSVPETAPALLRAALHGAGSLLAGVPGAPEEPPALAAAALARVARIAPDPARYREAAAARLEAETAAGNRDPWLFCAALDLYIAAPDAAAQQRLDALIPAPDPRFAESLALYDATFDSLEPFTFQLSMDAAPRIAALIELAANPFGLAAALLAHANELARLYRFNAKPEVQAFLYAQVHWLLGNNPAGLCLAAGLAPAGSPGSAYGTAPGAPPGALAGGFIGRGLRDDRPLFDPANPACADARLGDAIALLQTIGGVKRIRALS